VDDFPHHAQGSAFSKTLALLGGPKTIAEDLPREWPGVYWMGDEERAALLGVLDGTVGFQEDLEPALREYFGCTWAGAINSGSGALFAATSALDIGPGMEVLIPGFCWIPTFACVISKGAIPVLVEVGEDLGIDPVDMVRKITSRTRAVLVAHMCGAAANMSAIMAVAREHNLMVIEDCAQDNGGKYKGEYVGLFGQFGAFSLQQSKHCTSYGGGFMLSRSAELGRLAEMVRDVGLSGGLRRLIEISAPDPAEDVRWGEGRRLDPLMHALAVVQLKKLPKIIESMQRAQCRIKEAIATIPSVHLRPLDDPQSDCGSFLITYWPDRNVASKAAEALRAEGVPQSTFHLEQYGTHLYYNVPMLVRKVGWIANTRWPWDAPENRGSDYLYNRGNLPVSDELFSRAVVMAVPSVLSEQQCDKIGEAYCKVARYLIH
jgi:dTDP-4-amino-4,6-dideoxygalactose transaminase